MSLQLQKVDIKQLSSINLTQSAMETFGLIEYVDIFSVEKAILTLDGENINGNIINLSFGMHSPTACIWIEGIHENVTEKYLQHYFIQFGFVMNIEIDRTRQRALVFFQKVNFNLF